MMSRTLLRALCPSLNARRLTPRPRKMRVSRPDGCRPSRVQSGAPGCGPGARTARQSGLQLYTSVHASEVRMALISPWEADLGTLLLTLEIPFVF